jgi:hypothetical protein
VHAGARHDDDRIAGLTGARRRAVQHATTRAALAPDNVGSNTRTGILVPDLDKFQRQYAYRFTMLGVERD